MKTSTVAAAGLVAVFASAGAARGSGEDGVEGALDRIRPESLRADVRFLADDALEGRGTGTRGYEVAARFVAAQMEAAGLEPAGDGGTYFQEVPLRAYQVEEAATTMTLLRTQPEKLTFRSDFIADGDPARAETSVEAPVVYVGYGVTAPEQGYDDYAGIDVHGKIVALVFGAPPTFEPSLRAHYSSSETKKANAIAHGAVGILGLDDPVLESVYSFATRVRDLSFRRLRWLDAHGNPADAHPELQAEASLSMEGVAKLLAGSGHTADEVYAATRAGRPRPFTLPGAVRIHVASRLSELKSPNVVAKLPGSDPSLKDEYVVYTAHLDHLGMGEPVAGDRIYNGALDNGSGSAGLIEIARALARMKERPRRSILFVAVTGEEAGLRGSDYFARNPTVPRNELVANVNMDEDLMFWPVKDMIVYGAEHSSLGRVAEEAARRLGLVLSPDSQPEQVFFVRSDQYSFVKQGIPALAGTVGLQTTDPRLHPKEIEERWIRTIYHKPQDDMAQPFDWSAAVTYARFHLLCGYLIAQDPPRPQWNKGDFFGDTYGKKAGS
jgi:Peptidase family M28